MSSVDTNRQEIAVAVDGRAGAESSDVDWRGSGLRVVSVDERDPDDSGAAALAEVEAVVVDGDDRLLSRVVTALGRASGSGGWPTLVPLRTGRLHRVADDVGGPEPSDSLAERLASEGMPEDWTSVRRTGLRATTSARRAPVWGFSVGAGAVFELFEAWQRGEGQGFSALSSIGARLVEEVGGSGGWSGAEETRATVDYEPVADGLEYLVATTLETTWLGVAGANAGRPVWMGGDSGGEFLRRVAGSAALPSFLSQGGGDAFERLHLDGSGGFVVDGELYDPGEPHVLEVSAGVDMSFSSP